MQRPVDSLHLTHALGGCPKDAILAATDVGFQWESALVAAGSSQDVPPVGVELLLS